MPRPGLEVELLLSGPMGGDLQIGARLAIGEVDAVIFLRDPMTPQPHEPDINALVRACDVHDVPCATNVAGARLLLSGAQRAEASRPQPRRQDVEARSGQRAARASARARSRLSSQRAPGRAPGR